MRPAEDCADPVLLAAEVRRLRSVIDSGESVGAIGSAGRDSPPPVALTDAEREAIEWAVATTAERYDDPTGPINREVLRGLLERTK